MQFPNRFSFSLPEGLQSLKIALNMGSIQEVAVPQTSSTKVLVIGGAYAGLAASLNLLDLCAGRLARFNPKTKPTEPLPIEIKIVDERDGYCAFASE